MIRKEASRVSSYIVSVLVVLGISSLACGPEIDEEADEKCERLITQVCEKEASCSFFETQESCESDMRTNLDCGAAVGVSESYDRCLDDVDRSSCSTFGLPASCERVILTQ